MFAFDVNNFIILSLYSGIHCWYFWRIVKIFIVNNFGSFQGPKYLYILSFQILTIIDIDIFHKHIFPRNCNFAIVIGLLT